MVSNGPHSTKGVDLPPAMLRASRWVFFILMLLVGFCFWRVPELLLLTPPPHVPPHVARSNCPRQHRGSPAIVMFIPTPIKWAHRRQLVLKQFRRELGVLRSSVHLLFVMGSREGPRLEFEMPEVADAHAEIGAESQPPFIRYIVTGCRDFGDEPDNANGTSSTTCKVYEGLRHIAAFYKQNPPQFVWRGADDAYVDLIVFRKYVMSVLQSCRLFAGRMRFPSLHGDTDLELSTTSQPELYSLFGLKKFGKYLSGMSFYMSWDVARFIGESSIPPRLTWCEDIMVSHWLLFYDIDVVDIHATIPVVRMIHADTEMDSSMHWLMANNQRVLVAHRMSDAQWRALHHRPVGSESTRFLLAQ